MSCFRKPDRPSHFAPDSNFFRHNLHSVKIGNLRSVSQAPFRLHSIVSVQRQHGKSGAQANHVVSFFSMHVSGTGTLGNVLILSLALLHSPNIKVNSAIQYIQLVFFLKVPKRRIPSCLCTQIHSNYGKKQLPFVCKQTLGLSDLGVYHVIILAGIISYINYFIFCLISIYRFSVIFSNTKIINNTKLKTEKIDCQSYFGVMQGSVMRTLICTY